MPSGARAYYNLDADMRFVSANATALAYWGKRAEEVIGRPMSEVFPQVVGSAAYEAHTFALHSLRPFRGRCTSPVIGKIIDLEIYPNENGVRVSFAPVAQAEGA